MVLLTDYIAGIAGGVAVVIVGHPFDTTKTRLQTAPTGFYKSTFDCVRKTFRYEGLKGFYSGISSPLIGQMFFRSASFATFFHTIEYFKIKNNRVIKPSHILISGSITGFVISFIECPIDLVKTKMQTRIFANKASASISSTVKNVTRENGLKGLFQGLSGTIIRNVPANGLFFPVNEIVKQKLAVLENVAVDRLSMTSRLISGACAGIGYWVTFYPLDLIKSTMHSMQYNNKQTWTKTASEIYRKNRGGIKNFYKGFIPCAVRSVPACGAMFTTVDLVREVLT